MEAGADFVMTQPILRRRRLAALPRSLRRPDPGSGHDRDSAAAERAPRRVSPQRGSGHHPDRTALERMHEAGPNGRAVGVEMARDLLLELKPLAQGVYLMPSFGPVRSGRRGFGRRRDSSRSGHDQSGAGVCATDPASARQIAGRFHVILKVKGRVSDGCTADSLD